jgi:membrane protein required for colicin V production
MNWLDIVIIIIWLFSALGGLKSGIINSLFSLAGLILGVVMAGRFHAALSSTLGFIQNQNIARLVAFGIIFMMIVVLASLLGWFFTHLVSNISLGWLNRFVGAVFGVIVGSIFVGAVLAVWVKYVGPNPVITGSALAPVLLDRFPLVLALLPQEFDSVRQFFRGSFR